MCGVQKKKKNIVGDVLGKYSLVEQGSAIEGCDPNLGCKSNILGQNKVALCNCSIKKNAFISN